MKIASLFFGIIFCACVLACYHIQKGPEIQNDDLIDSLITVKHINDNVIILSFGSEAVTAIYTTEGIIMIDAGISTGLALKYRKIIENEFRDNTFRYVIITHYHPDHYGGNGIFEEAKVIGHGNGIKEIMQQWKDTAKIVNSLSKVVHDYDVQLQDCQEKTDEWYDAFKQKTRYNFALDDAEKQIHPSNPDITFTDSLKIFVGTTEVDMIYFGACHSTSDILVYIPEYNMLFTGDLFFKYGRPSINYGPYNEQWKRAIAWIENRIQHIEIVINGHGEILSTDDLINFNRKILEKCADQ